MINFRKYLNKDFLTQNWILILILLIAAFLRLYEIDKYMTFLGDEGRDVLVAYNILHGHLTLLGPTSSVGGFFLGPIYYYFMAPFLFLSNYNPVGPAIMVALFGIVVVGLVYKIGESIFNRRVGLVAAFLYAISPIVIIYSKSSWNPNLMPFFTILTLYSLYFGLKKNKLIYFLICGISFGITMQLHYIEIFLSVIIFFYVLLFYYFKKQFNLLKIIKNYATIFIGFLIGFSPFILFEVRHDFTNSINIFNFIFHSPTYTGSGGQVGGNIWEVFLRLFGGIVLNFPLPVDFPHYNPSLISVWIWFSIILGGVSIVLFIYQLRRFSKIKDDRFFQTLLLLIWLFFGIVLFGFYKKSIYDYYLEFMYPLPFLLIGNLAIAIFECKKYFNIGKIISVLVVLIIIISSILFSPLRNQPNQQVKQTITISNFVLSQTNGQPFNFALITGGNSDYAYRYFFKLDHRDPVVIQYPGIDPKRTSVTNQLMVVCDSLPCSPLGDSLWEVAGFGRAQIVGHWKVSVVEVYKLVHYSGK